MKLSKLKIQKVHWKPPPKWSKKNSPMHIIDALNVTVAMGIVGILAVLFNMPLIFPSLGATAYLLFAHTHEHQGQMKNAFFSHLFAAVIGLAMFKIVIVDFGNQHAISALEIILNEKSFSVSILWWYVVSSALSIGFTQLIMVFTGTEHSPAGSTTLIFSLGLFQHIWEVGVLMLGVLLLLICSEILNRLAGFMPVIKSLNNKARP